MTVFTILSVSLELSKDSKCGASDRKANDLAAHSLSSKYGCCNNFGRKSTYFPHRESSMDLIKADIIYGLSVKSEDCSITLSAKSLLYLAIVSKEAGSYQKSCFPINVRVNLHEKGL